MKKKIILLAAMILLMSSLTGCTKSCMASCNVSKEADNFNVLRRLTVINARTDKLLLELEGCFSLQNNTENELEVICEVEEGVYRKYFVYLNEYTIYVVEDISGAEVSPYHFEISILPDFGVIVEEAK